MATLIKNVPDIAVVPKGNRGLLSTSGLKFLLYTEWYNLISNVADLTINTAQQMVMIREPLENSAALTEESTETFKKFYAIPSDLTSKVGSLGLDVDGPLEIISSPTNNFGDIWTAFDAADILDPLSVNKPWLKILLSNDGKIMTAMTSDELYVSEDTGSNWLLRNKLTSGLWKKIAMSADGTYQTAVAQGGKIYTSNDYGYTWTSVESDRQWTDVAISSDGIFQTAVVDEGQIYVSTDYGSTWTPKSSNQKWFKVEVSLDGATQVAFSNISATAIYVSVDFGATWNLKNVSPAFEFASSKMSSTGVVQAVVTSYKTVYVSSNAGSTWIAKEFGNARDGRIAMSSDGSKMTIAARKVDPSTPSGVSNVCVFVSTNSGSTWTIKESEELPKNSNIQDIQMSADGTKQLMIDYSSDGKIYLSTDSGNTWSAKEFRRSWSSIDITPDGTRMIASTNPGKIYTNASV